VFSPKNDAENLRVVRLHNWHEFEHIIADAYAGIHQAKTAPYFSITQHQQSHACDLQERDEAHDVQPVEKIRASCEEVVPVVL
jgi:hypothetical protein